MFYFCITIVLVCIQEQVSYPDLDIQKGPKRFEDDSHAVAYGQMQVETKQKQSAYADLDIQKGPPQRTQRIKDDGNTVDYGQVAGDAKQ